LNLTVKHVSVVLANQQSPRAKAIDLSTEWNVYFSSELL